MSYRIKLVLSNENKNYQGTMKMNQKKKKAKLIIARRK